MGKIFDFQNIEPKEILKWFKKICAIPHGSFKEQALASMLKNELEKAGAKVQVLSSGALYITQKATFDHDSWPTVLLQGHMDMVQVKDEGVKTDLEKEPVPAYYDEENKWLKAEGTTLGADNGVAISMFMEVLTNPKIEHGPLEALFTVGEETDTGPCMASIPNGLLKSKYYINLDSDHDNTIYYASAGVYKVPFEIPFKYTAINQKMDTYEIVLKNFSGGHSALIIHNPHINPITYICQTLLHFNDEVGKIALVSLNGGSTYNSIPTNVKLVVQVKPEDGKKLEQYISGQIGVAKVVAQNNETDAVFSVKKIEDANQCISFERSREIFAFFALAPNNMLTVSKNGGCMFNSSNIGLVKTEEGKLVSAFLPRSFYEPDLINISRNLVAYAKLFGCENVSYMPSCAGWLVQDYENSKLINLWKKNYKIVANEEPFILPNPGGLEVAEIVKKAPQMMANAMSAGPIIFKEHSTFENCPVESIKKIWKILTLTIRELDK